MTENEIAKIVFEAGLKIHRVLGPGLLESAYKECLVYELKKSGLEIIKEKALPLIYEDVNFNVGYRIDICIEHKFIVEIKALDSLNDIRVAQILTLLRLSKYKLGYVD